MKSFLFLVMCLFALESFASVRVFNSSDTNLGSFDKIKCDTGITCAQSSGKLLVSATGPIAMTGDLVGDGGDQLYGFLQNQIASTTTTLTAAQCGSTIVNDSADVVTLPEASTVLGCQFTFITGNASNFDVNPENSDKILVLTDVAGDAIRNATLGNSVVLQAISASEWAPVGAEKGTWTDIN